MVASVWAHFARGTRWACPASQIVFVFLLILTFEIVNYTFVSIAVALDQEHRWREVFLRIWFIQRKKTFVPSHLINMAGVLLATTWAWQA